jgi:hydrogenase maturation protein HypF
MEKTLFVRVYGIVQGVGFRPTVSRHAIKNGVSGSVCNKGPYVEIFVRGSCEQVDGFMHDLEFSPPERASILKIDARQIDDSRKYDGFQIIQSEKTTGEIFVSPDIAICPKCKQELYDKNNRRYLHPFINCTCCGPRLTILDSMPYDRVRTSMGQFPMCQKCRDEYTSPKSRRYDAQPVCCNDCGPQVYIIGTDIYGRSAITETRRVIARGGIAAIKGIGGFHLCCDAENEQAVARLRRLKRRKAKPFAVMMRDIQAVERSCALSSEQRAILDGHQKPIILLNRLPNSKLCQSVAPDNPKVGVMLPYAPVQLLIFDYDDGITMPDALVMTSGNSSGAPICRDDDDAVKELGHLCDVILSHDRKIRLRADDSVMDFYDGKPYMIRRSRGYAPMPFMLSKGYTGQVLAMGGELKNTFCVGKNDLFYPSPYIGDMQDVRTVKALEESVARMTTLLETQPTVVACDLHPKYNTTQLAFSMGLPVIQVQHHYAHILSCMGENDFSGRVIGVSFDGTGYGTDGTVWGGEILLADYDGFDRIGSIAPFIQAGGDLSAKEGWRIAASMIHSLYPDEKQAIDIIKSLDLCSEQNAKIIFTQADRHINAVASTSAGRLFDAVSAILNVRKTSSFEGEASTTLQFRAEAAEKCYEPDISFDMVSRDMILNTPGLVKSIIGGALAGEDGNALARYFHESLAQMVEGACVIAREKTGVNTVALSGGVYQNKLLLTKTIKALEKHGFNVLHQSLLPPNDGGICLGQAIYAMNKINK